MNEPFSKQALFDALQSFFHQNGYSYHPVLNQFRKYNDSGFTNVIISPTEYDDLTLVECSFGARINLVEDSIMPFSTGINEHKTESNTCVTNLAQYLSKPYYRVKFNDGPSFKRAVKEICEFFEQEGFHFLSSICNVKKLDELFNKTEDEYCPFTFNQQMRCFRGMVLASIAQNPNWSNLQQSYLKSLYRQGTPHIIIDRFHRLTRQLSDISLN